MSRSFREMSRFDVVSPKGRRIGRIGDALVHPDRPEVVGFSVERSRLLMVWDRNDRYIARDGFERRGDSLVASGASDTWDRAAAKRFGVTWDKTVVWYGMPVRTQAGERLGVVRDALFDESTGAIEGIGLTGGVTADTTLGVRDIPVKYFAGFDGESIVVMDEALEVELTGGAAEAAGKSAAVLKVQAGEAAKVAGEAARKAAKYGTAAAKAAAKSDTGKKAVGWLKAIKDEVVDAMGPPDDDD